VSAWGILLDSGHIWRVPGNRTSARNAIVRWRARRRRALVAGDIVVPRAVIGLVCFKPATSKPARQLGKSGGIARAAKLSPARRSEIAKAAAAKRWSNRAANREAA
jgi:hypothetical protein